MPKLPLKMNVLKVVIDRGPVGEAEIVRALETEYGTERHFTPRAVTKHLLALRAVGLVYETFPIGPDGSEYAAFEPTQTAKSKMEKYIK